MSGPPTEGRERTAVADSGPAQGQKDVWFQDDPGIGKTAGPAGGDVAGDAHHPRPPGS